MAWIIVGRRHVMLHSPSDEAFQDLGNLLLNEPNHDIDLQIVRTLISSASDTEREGLSYHDVGFLVGAILQSKWTNSRPALTESLRKVAIRHIEFEAEWEARSNPVAAREASLNAEYFQSFVAENMRLRTEVYKKSPGFLGLMVDEANGRVRRVGYEAKPDIQFPVTAESSDRSVSPVWHTFLVAFNAGGNGATNEMWMDGYTGDVNGKGPAQSKQRVKKELQKLDLTLENGSGVRIIEWDGRS